MPMRKPVMMMVRIPKSIRIPKPMGAVQSDVLRRHCTEADVAKMAENRVGEMAKIDADADWFSIPPKAELGRTFAKMLAKYSSFREVRGRETEYGLTADQMVVFRQYSDKEVCEEHNILLLTDSERLMEERIAKWILTLHSACFCCVSQQELPLVSYRTLQLSAAEFRDYQEIGMSSETFYTPAFMSTTRSRSVAEGWKGNTLMRVWLSGLGKCGAVDISMFSHYPEEQEVLLPVNSRFRVLLTTFYWPDDGTVGRFFEYYIEVELLPPVHPLLRHK